MNELSCAFCSRFQSFDVEEEHINASYTDGQQSQDGTK
jgi:hypothetical protein